MRSGLSTYPLMISGPEKVLKYRVTFACVEVASVD